MDRGAFGFVLRDHFVRVVPIGGKDRAHHIISVQLELSLSDARDGNRSPMDQLIIALDGDAGATESHQANATNLSRQLFAVPSNLGALAAPRIDVVALRASDASLPATLDGLVYEAFRTAHPNRAECIDEWLSRRPDRPDANHKERMWSSMAGWFPEQGCESFLQNAIWHDEAIASALLESLRGGPVEDALLALESD